jgi:hypothetical protein
MNARRRGLQRMLSAEAERANARLITLETTGRNHFEAVFLNKGGAYRSMFLSATPSDVRTIRNDTAQVRRLLRA